jgi:ABC-type transport system substrate-binding protein
VIRARPLTAACAAAVVVTLAAGCTGGAAERATPASSPTTVEPRRGGTLRYGLAELPASIDPTAAPLRGTALLVARAVFDPLAAFDRSGNAVPYLAEAIRPSDGFRSWDVYLRRGVRFHDGARLDAAAVADNVRRQLADPDLAFALRPLLARKRAVTLHREDPLRLTFRLATPVATFPVFLTTQVGLVASPRWLAARSGAPAGTGPFEVRRAGAGEWRLDRNRRYWQGGRPRLAHLRFVRTGDAVRAIDRGEVDMIATDDPGALTRLRGDARVDVFRDRSGPEVYLHEASQLFTSARVRDALLYATDRAKYAAAVAGSAANAADGPFAPGTVWSPDSDAAEIAGPDRARAAGDVEAVCAEQPTACTRDGRIEIRVAYRAALERRVAVLADQWRGLFRVRPVPFDDAAAFARLARGDDPGFDVLLAQGWGGFDPGLDWHEPAMAFADPDPQLGVFTGNQIVDRQLTIQWQTTDVATRRDAWSAIVAELHTTGRALFLNHTEWMVALNPRVHGFARVEGPDHVDLAPQTAESHWFTGLWLDPDRRTVP